MSFAVDGIIDLYSFMPGDSTTAGIERLAFTFPFFCAVADNVVDNAITMVNILRFIFLFFKNKDKEKR